MKTLLGSALVIACAGLFVSAHSETITDPANDVYRWDGGLADSDISGKPDIDIRGLSAVRTDSLTITMTVEGIISNSDLVQYAVSFETDDAVYTIIYDDSGEWLAVAESKGEAFLPSISDNITVAGSTVTVIFGADATGESDNIVDFFALAQEFEGSFGSDSWHIDFAPDSETPSAYLSSRARHEINAAQSIASQAHGIIAYISGKGTIEVSYTHDIPEKTIATLYDVSGKLLQINTSAPQKAGTNTFAFSSTVAPGGYVVTVTTPSEKRAVRVSNTGRR